MRKSGLVELEVVLAVARRNGFRAAAVDLDISTSAVSSAVAGLENRLGVRLFHRTTRSVSLTEDGARFVRQIEPSVKGIQDAMAAIGDRPDAPTGTLRLNSSLGAALMIFRPILAEYLRRYPGMKVDVTTEGRMVDIVGEGFDAGLRPSSLVPRDMIRVPLGRDVPMVVVGSADYFSRTPPPDVLQDLTRHSCIRARLPSGALSSWEFVEGGHSLTMDVPGSLVLDAPVLMLEAAREGIGLTQLADWYVTDDVASGRLLRVLDSWAPKTDGLCLYYSGHRYLPAGLRALIDLIHERRHAWP